MGTSAPTTRKLSRDAYRIVRVDELQAGDVLRISRTRVDAIDVGQENTTVWFTNGRVGVFHNADRFGIYR